jgi:hypothetical protein
MIPQFLADMRREQDEASRAMQGVQSKLAESMTETLYVECQNQIDRCTNARQELWRISEAISHAANHVDQVASWWVAAETSLGKISEDIRSIQADRLIKLRLKQIRDSCDVVKGKYLEYKSEVRPL